MFSEHLKREVPEAIGCGHTEHYKSVGRTVEGEVLLCDWCGDVFNDPSNPQKYTPEENDAWWREYRKAIDAVRQNTACFVRDGHHSPCMACRDYRDAERAAQNTRIRASTAW